MNKFNDPEEPQLSEVAAFTKESFLKDGYVISQDNAYLCIAREQRGDDERYASAYQVLRDGYAVECFAKNLTTTADYVKKTSETLVRELQAKMTQSHTLTPQEIAFHLNQAFLKDGFEMAEDNANYCISYEMRKNDERYATAYEVLRDGHAAECLEKSLKAK